jgi:uncharacterized protein YkwD
MATRGFFSHDDPERGGPDRRLTRAGIPWRAVAENIYRQRGYRDPVARAVEGWMRSPGHRQNILNPEYTHSGTGVFISGDGTAYYTQIFLRPASGRSQ